jgi:FMN reductase
MELSLVECHLPASFGVLAAMNSTPDAAHHTPLIVGLGGTTRAESSTERWLGIALDAAHRHGARVVRFSGPLLASLPLYAPEEMARNELQRELVATVRQADGLILATPAYHAGISGLLKNAIDLLEDLRNDVRPYLQDRAVGCIVTAHGLQGAGATLISLRTIVHALRGWPTPLGVTVNTVEPQSPSAPDKRLEQVGMLAWQVVEFARRWQSGAPHRA